MDADDRAFLCGYYEAALQAIAAEVIGTTGDWTRVATITKDALRRGEQVREGQVKLG